MRELVGDERPGEYFEPLASGHPLEGAVVDNPDQLRADQHVQAKLETGETAHAPENRVGPVTLFDWDVVLLHERSKQGSMSLLFADEQLHDERDRLRVVCVGELP